MGVKSILNIGDPGHLYIKYFLNRQQLQQITVIHFDWLSFRARNAMPKCREVIGGP